MNDNISTWEQKRKENRGIGEIMFEIFFATFLILTLMYWIV
jgi:hypothetical protein